MRDLTFGQIQRRATAAGLVMSRRGLGIHLRYRDGRASDPAWTGLNAAGALSVVEMVERRSGQPRPDPGPGVASVRRLEPR